MSAVGTDTSYKTPVATIVDGYDGDQSEFVDGNDDGDKGNTEMKATTAKKAIRMMITTRMIKEITEMKATAEKKAMKMMMTKRMVMTAITPPTM